MQREIGEAELVEILPAEIPGVERVPELGIVVRESPVPDPTWLQQQIDPRMREKSDDPWFEVMPLSGGLLLLPRSLIGARGEPTYEQFCEAVDSANSEGRRALAQLFPKHVAEAQSKVKGES